MIGPKSLPLIVNPYLAAYADLRLQFGELLLVHYKLLHLGKKTKHKQGVFFQS